MAGIDKLNTNSEHINQVIEFPAEYGIKIVGRAEADFEDIVKSILADYLDNEQPVSYSYRKSGRQKYISVTCTFVAKSRQQLDQIYAKMSAHPKVLMVL